MCSLVMSPLSRDYMKTEIDQIKSISNVLTDLHVYRIQTALLDGRTSILVVVDVVT